MPVPEFPRHIDGAPGAETPLSPVPATERQFAPALRPDVYARLHERRYKIAPGRFRPRIAERTGYTNHLPRSADFSTWTLAELTRTPAAAPTPWDGSVAVERLLETVANAGHSVTRAFTFTAVTHVLWALVADVGRGFVRLRASDGSTDFDGFFDLARGRVVSASVGTAATVRVLEDGWRQVAIAFTPAAATGSVAVNTSTDGAAVSFAGDITKGILLAQVQVERAGVPGPVIVTAGSARTVSVPDLDADDPFAFLLEESPKPEMLSSLAARYARTYGRLPTDQVVEDSKFFQRPNLDGVSIATHWGVSFDEGESSWVFSARKAIASIALPVRPVATTSRPLLWPGVTITINGPGSTGFFSTSDGVPAIRAAYAAAIGGAGSNAALILVSPTGIYLSNLITANPYAFSCTNANITITGGPGNVSILPREPETQSSTAPSSRGLVITGHGYSAGANIALWQGAKLVARTRVLTVADANTITVPLEDVPGDDFKATHAACAGVDACVRYKNGIKPVSTLKTARFYLPGYSDGIASGEDIPLRATQVDPVSWLQAIADAEAWPVESVSGFAQWRGPVLVQETTTLQMSDALETLTP